MPGVGFIRVKLLQAETGPNGPALTDPFLAINIKEAVEVPGMFMLNHLCKLKAT